MSTEVPDARGVLKRLIPPTPMSKRLAIQSMLFSTGDGAFMTGSAVFLTQVVGLSAAMVGLGLTIAGVLEFLLAYPAGRIVDRLGPKRVWAVASSGHALSFALLPFVTSFEEYLAVALLFALVGSAGGAAHQAYVIDVLPRKERIETQAYMYSSLNVGFTVGAMVGGLALATGSLDVIRWSPWLSAALLAANAFWIVRLPKAPHDLRVASGAARVKPTGPGPMRNRGWMALTFFLGVLWTNQVLLHTVIPLWLVEATDAPHVLLAWLFGTNTVLCIFLPAYTSKGVRDLASAKRYVWISTGFFVISCLITMVTHSTVGLVTVLLVWLGHVTVTGAELFVSGASWAVEAELMDPRRRGEYQGVAEVFSALGSKWAPAVYTFLAMSWGAEGWLIIAAIIVAAAIGTGPAIRRAQAFAEEHFEPDEVAASVAEAGADPGPEADAGTALSVPAGPA
ncbi:MFS transporter [Nocardioides sp. YIM 152588]|uniref:MFS transporter n=1 Tax=Nocardioides sp. YIM 152588 TaxID=3158259 RepID=UPI0032E37B73